MGTDNQIAELLGSLMRDLLAGVLPSQLLNSLLLPAQVLLGFLDDIKHGQEERWTQGRTIDLPRLAWMSVREKYPAAAAFPLGPVAERAFKRYLARLTRCATDGEGEGRPATQAPPAITPPRLDPGLSEALGKHSAQQHFGAYLGFWLFEAAMLNLRGSAKQLEEDFGFWYHWTPSGRWRTLEQEAALRTKLAQECQRQASRLLDTCLRERPVDAVGLPPETVIGAFQEVFELVLPEPPERTGEHQVRPFSVLGVKLAGSPRRQNVALAEGAKEIVVRGRGANVHLDSDELLACCGGKLDGLLQDLLEIAATVYLADVYVRRRNNFARDLTFLLPVRFPEVWSSHAEALALPVSFLTGNTVEFHMTAAPRAKQSPKSFKVSSDGRCVALFSGGLDSFVGATHLLQDGRQPVLVSHVPGPALRGIQKHLIEALRKRHPGLRSVSVPVSAASVRQLGHEGLGPSPPQCLYQYARSFLFLSMAACLAIQTGIADIYVYENGPVALNPSFSEARFNTRTTHPVFFQYFLNLVRSVFGVELRIHNPFALRTKAEVLKELDPSWRGQIRMANSCWSYSHVHAWAEKMSITDFAGAHCGRCVPCVWRRAAIHRAGLSAFDDDYLTNHAAANRGLDRRHLTVLWDLARFCQNALARTDTLLLDLCPDFCEGDGTPGERLVMYRRFARETIGWLRTVTPELRPRSS